MSKTTRLGWAAYAIAGIVILADQLSKAWILGPFDLPERGPVDVLPVLRLTMVWNHGVSFGLLNSHGDVGRWALVLFETAVAIALAVWARRNDRPILALALAMIMGGALGNVIDRVRFGAVVDFIDVTPLHFPWVFNLADSAINIGVALLLWDALTSSGPAATSRRA
ncbi:MAG TPA: signal peptidase II [Caulobacteraceae bacterium]|jgi:signal peptidase II|nr:signal peptidase II [Caulobacteraceae bacterium]